jgi:two-component system cell cycle response regulator
MNSSSANRKQAGEGPLRDEALRKSEANFRALAETIASGIFLSQRKRLDYVNHAAETITGYTREELTSMSFWDIVHPDLRELESKCDLESQDEMESALRYEVRILTKTGEERWLDIAVTRIDFDDEPATLISASDLTERKQAEEQMQMMQLLAVTDPLTGLGNYRRLHEILNAEIKRSARTSRPFSVLLLDLDALKKINDRYGHLVGDQALCRLGEVLRVSCRAIDTAARYGGDEFAVILPETTAEAAGVVATRIRDRLAAHRQEPSLSVSVGVAVYPGDGETIEALLRTGDRGLYEMKNRGAEKPFPTSPPRYDFGPPLAGSREMSSEKRNRKLKRHPKR